MANKASWLTAAQARPLKVDDAPMPQPSADEVVVRNHAVAINPVDWAIQAAGMLPLPYPHIGGCDTAGEIEAVGSSVKNLKVGDRVVATLDPYGGGDGPDSRRGAFQLFSLAREAGTTKIPDNISYSEAAVLPLAVSTSASALFQNDTLGLQLSTSGGNRGKVVLIWGGATSLGACAIQLVSAAGYDVATTSSTRNFDSMKSLGAKYVFDHAKANVVDDIIAELKHLDFGGVYCVVLVPEAIKQCAEIASKLDGRKLVSTVLAPVMPLADDLPSDVRYTKVYGTSLLDNEVGPAVWGKMVPEGLASGTFKCVPPPLVVGQGLEAIQGALDRWREGVSYQKVVVELP
ncbi:uncharacterized protein A1O9_02533 [Exophiala aquamarina CBS 119918]|uniref:Enoyl reductase (ER) domain-containing protein n=1 Tax=Exophiala aquamarina CBS 119918 TaxID=1182545 RepID=A0A072PLK0_9EURO|nr:uncharacterized protein A1O9_02533 [Exophiala aquamarina CBS 119918]KEF60969.1 hypothetical protein A1O9_02533 [Exophiala aquamarina CBS 119918]